jgi:hypothetical protein
MKQTFASKEPVAPRLIQHRQASLMASTGLFAPPIAMIPALNALYHHPVHLSILGIPKRNGKSG